MAWARVTAGLIWWRSKIEARLINFGWVGIWGDEGWLTCPPLIPEVRYNPIILSKFLKTGSVLDVSVWIKACLVTYMPIPHPNCFVYSFCFVFGDQSLVILFLSWWSYDEKNYKKREESWLTAMGKKFAMLPGSISSPIETWWFTPVPVWIKNSKRNRFQFIGLYL